MPLVKKIEHDEPNKQNILKEYIEKFMVLNFSLVEKGTFQKLNYVINFENYFGKQICDLRSYKRWVEFETSLMFFLLLMGRKTLVLFFFIILVWM